MNRTSLTTATLALTTALLAGCSNETPTEAPSADDTEVGHIHGLGIDPADGTLYVATHFGLFHVKDDHEPTRVADRYQDTMAFTVVGPGHFLGSGQHYIQATRTSTASTARISGEPALFPADSPPSTSRQQSSRTHS